MKELLEELLEAYDVDPMQLQKTLRYAKQQYIAKYGAAAWEANKQQLVKALLEPDEEMNRALPGLARPRPTSATYRGGATESLVQKVIGK